MSLFKAILPSAAAWKSFGDESKKFFREGSAGGAWEPDSFKAMAAENRPKPLRRDAQRAAPHDLARNHPFPEQEHLAERFRQRRQPLRVALADDANELGDAVHQVRSTVGGCGA